MKDKTRPDLLNLTAADFADMMGVAEADMPLQARAALAKADLRYDVVRGDERDACLLKALKELDRDLSVSGPERIGRWEDGWGENLDEYIRTGSLDSLQPKYFHYEYLRFRGDYIRAESVRFEQDFYTVARNILFKQYLSDATSVVEFGCGPGTSLLILSELFPDKPLVGCDWATSSQGLTPAPSPSERART